LIIYIMGAPADFLKAEELLKLINKKNVINLCGKQGILEETVIYQFSKMNYVLDSAPMHICSAMNAPQTAIYCSTSPKFGFIPFSDQKNIVMTLDFLSCHPCGKHGHKNCPKKHFKCGDISAKLLLNENK
jgi:ADP-heptose:LPS heptosyltransferase